jgi:haloalkane dehalogenase
LVIANTALPTGGSGVNKTFKVWAALISQMMPSWTLLMQSGTNSNLEDSELAAYEAPFPSEDYKVATRVYPQLVPQMDEHMSVEENKGGPAPARIAHVFACTVRVSVLNRLAALPWYLYSICLLLSPGAFRRVFMQFKRPVLTLFSDNDAVTKGGEQIWQSICPGAKLPGIPHQIMPGSHFLQEDCGDEICKIMIEFIANFPVDLPAPAARL